ncbi:glycosyltransferase [Acidithiobacillus thiooxidans]|uniref:glycosyltransferase n=1 Tax=Acidithiobacillus thiooxidans TaxID=930 RepID=UPI002866B3CF|nr:glycosyltransferase [Acidithiobacillus thiooxidans]MDR7925525.1 glycosyltransferase [Acidithiobacillus thiooxidans]
MGGGVRFSIAMATYNGSIFIKEQLASLEAQTYKPFEIVVVDDGSKDNTLEIVNYFAKSSTISFRIFTNEKNLGYSDNFFKSALLCEGDYICFCDQDDFWLPNKLEVVAQSIAENSPDLIVHSSFVVDVNLSVTDRLFPNFDKNSVIQKRRGNPWESNVPGFSLVVNSSLLSKAVDWKNRPLASMNPEQMRNGHKIISHDLMMYFLAHSFGVVSIISEPLVYYRMHKRNVCGAPVVKSYSSFLKRISSRLEKTINVGKFEYDFISEVAFSRRKWLLYYGKDLNIKYHQSISSASEYWLVQYKIYKKRAAIYDRDTNFYDSLTGLINMYISNSYISKKNGGLGYGAILKDFFVVIFYKNYKKIFNLKNS